MTYIAVRFEHQQMFKIKKGHFGLLDCLFWPMHLFGTLNYQLKILLAKPNINNIYMDYPRGKIEL